jgi:hypothetical protein
MSEERYKNGKIYTIRYRGDDNLIYVGSTCLPLYKRWHNHKKGCFNENYHGYNYYVYQKIRETNNINDWYIELYEEYPCENKEQLLKREGEVIRELGNLNQRIAGRSYKEYYEDNKEQISERQKKYYEDHKEKRTDYQKQYYEDNKEKVSEQKRQYDIKNKEKISEYQKQYQSYNKERISGQKKEYYEQNKEKFSEHQKKYQNENKEKLLENKKIYYELNKEKISEQRKEKILCPCGCEVVKCQLKRHQQSKKHLDLINSNSNENNENL